MSDRISKSFSIYTATNCQSESAGSRCAPISRHAVPGFDSLDGVLERLLQNPLADGPEYEAQQPSLEGLTIAYNDHVDVGQTVGATREVVGVAGRACPGVGIGRR